MCSHHHHEAYVGALELPLAAGSRQHRGGGYQGAAAVGGLVIKNYPPPRSAYRVVL